MSLSAKIILHPAEYFSLLLATTLGANLLVMSTDFIMVILSLELISISSYLLTGFHFTKEGSEGSLKYFLFGSAATAVMIYGISLLFGFTETFQFASSQFVSKLTAVDSPLLLISGFFVLGGFLFKSSAAPFHLWAPDVYESAPLPVVAFFSVVPKLAGIAALMKFTLAMHLFGQASFDWQSILATVAIISIVIGNASALWQKYQAYDGLFIDCTGRFPDSRHCAVDACFHALSDFVFSRFSHREFYRVYSASTF